MSWSALCTPQSGAAVVIIGDHPGSPGTGGRRVGRHRRGGCTACCGRRRLDREAVAQVAVMFDHAANAAAEPLAPSIVVADLLESDGDETAPADRRGHVAERRTRPGPVPDLADDDVVEPFRYERSAVRRAGQGAGQVAVEGRPITAGVDVEMLTLLAFKRDQPPNVDTMRFLLEKRRRRPATASVDDPQWAEAADRERGEDVAEPGVRVAPQPRRRRRR